ncbi:hypothetical protein C0J52_22329 [Blattella germanica]|nr:hypothetical protein C0J52_22329 [Blattella germanica]
MQNLFDTFCNLQSASSWLYSPVWSLAGAKTFLQSSLSNARPTSMPWFQSSSGLPLFHPFTAISVCPLFYFPQVSIR